MRRNGDGERFGARQGQRPNRGSLSMLLALFIVVLGQAPGVLAQDRTPHNPNAYSGGRVEPASDLGSGRGPASVLVNPSEDYKIGAGDVLEIQVQDAPELSRSVRVGSGGTFLMPYAGRITAIQKTPEELGTSIADKLRGRYLRDPRVTVVVREYNSCSFFIQGAVRSPGVYQIEGHPSLLKLIALAGLAENHGSTAFILRPAKLSPGSSERSDEPKGPSDTNGVTDGSPASGQAQEPREYDLLKVNINGLLKGHLEQNAVINPGDIINIPTTDVFFVAGEVTAPGTFQLKDGTTLRQAISMAQGTTFKAATGRGIIFREDAATGRRQEVRVDIGAVMNGKKEDVPLVANDIVIVPNSLIKSVGKVLLTGLGTSAAMRVPY